MKKKLSGKNLSKYFNYQLEILFKKKEKESLKLEK